MKFFVSNYSCLQNPWLGGYHPQIPVLSVLNWICLTTPPPEKIPGYATDYQWKCVEGSLHSHRLSLAPSKKRSRVHALTGHLGHVRSASLLWWMQQYLSLFHCNNGYPSALPCYFKSTWLSCVNSQQDVNPKLVSYVEVVHSVQLF